MTCRVFIVAAKRTAIGNYLGSLKSKSAVALGTHVCQATLAQAKLGHEDIDEVIVGNVLSSDLGMGIARQIALKAGLSEETPAYTINMVCGSGMKSIIEAYNHIRTGDADCIVSIGTESMSNAPYTQTGQIRSGVKIGHMHITDSILQHGLTDAFTQQHMGAITEHLANQYHITRQEQDNFALLSHQKADYARERGFFDAEIEPISIIHHNEELWFDEDEHIRSDSNLDALCKLSPTFQEGGTITAGNASSINDGASAIILVSEDFLNRHHHLRPLGEIISYGQGGVAPEMMGLGCIPAIAQAIERSDITLREIERIELNEAFAAQSIAVIHELAEQHEDNIQRLTAITNPTGGAIALGHPLGCSGNRIVTTLLYGLMREQQTFGLAALCIGGGMGTAMIIKVSP